MKKILLYILCAATAVSASLTLTACDKEKKTESKQETTAPVTTQAPATEVPVDNTAVTTAPSGDIVKEADLTKLLAVKKPDALFAGDWLITAGEGSQLEHFVYRFNGEKKAYIMVGTMGYTGTYSLSQKDGKDIFTTQLMFGLNGSYTYAFSGDKRSVVLTNIATNKTTTLTKTTDYSPIPKPSDSPEIDEALLGAWADGNGGYLYFDKSGVYFEEQKDFSFFFYTYSAKDGSITQTYTMTEETTDTYTYKVEGDSLTLNDYAYTRVSATEL